MALSEQQIHDFWEHGFCAPLDVLTREEAAALANALEQAEGTYPQHLHAEHRNNAHLVFPFLAALACDARIVDKAASLVGEDLSLWSSVLFIKEPRGTQFVSWHQDATYMGLSPQNFVTAWVALTPSTAQSGCVAVIPGSHTHENAPHEDTFAQDNILTRGQRIVDVDETRAVNLELEPGQMSLHHPWLIHGSRPNQSTSRRIGVALQSYLGGDVRPTRGAHHVMHVRGEKPTADFVEVAPPTATCTEDAIKARAAANDALSDVLYTGATMRREL